MTARHTHLVFDSQIGGTKPVTVVDVGHKCPFCNRDELTGVIAADGPLLLIANKYPVLQETFQTVLIETEDCAGELSLYPKDHLYRLIRFGIRNWLDMTDGGEFTSVLFFKNHGPNSGAARPKIVGLPGFIAKPCINSPGRSSACIAGTVKSLAPTELPPEMITS